MLIYDIEILKAIPPKDAREMIPGVEYCAGWHDHKNMGIACICAYDYQTDRYRVFTEANLPDFLKLVSERQLLVGFNSIAFDNKVLEAVTGFTPPNTDYDILREIWVSLGLSPTFQYPSHAGYGLDEMCRANFGTTKTGNGAMAPVFWQEKKYGEVIDYCLNDVKLTKQLFDKALAGESIKNPKTGEYTFLRLPEVN